MELHDALEDVDIAFKQLEFTIKLLSYCESEKIKPEDFDTHHLVVLKGGSLNFPSRHFGNTDSLVRAARISVLLAFSASVLVLDKAFEIIGMASNPESTDNVVKLRTLIYMLRCAQAHGIAEPIWEVRGPYARDLAVDLDGTTIPLALQTLNGKPFNIDQLGGYQNWYLIRRAAIQALKGHTKRGSGGHTSQSFLSVPSLAVPSRMNLAKPIGTSP